MDDWLARTKELQREMGYTFPIPRRELPDFLRTHAIAAVVELGEALQETDWKPWRSNDRVLVRAAFLEELVDAAHFIANLAIAVECSDQEWDEIYRQKDRVVRQRLRDRG